MAPLPDERTTVLYKNTIKYLHDLAEKAPNTLNVLKSYYASKFRISELQTKITLGKNINKSETRCPKCCLKFRETDASYVVTPEVKKSKFARKVLDKVKKNRKLTKFQALYLKNNELKEGNRFVITCSFCTKETVQVCSKPVKPQVVTIADTPVVERKKKKRKKDKFAGLQQNVVMAVQESLTRNGAQKPNNKRKKKDKKVENRVELEAKNRVLKNPISKKNEKMKKKKMINKLNNMLKQNNSKSESNSSLTLFLQSFSK